jgi:predicted metal-dependent peptidase
MFVRYSSNGATNTIANDLTARLNTELLVSSASQWAMEMWKAKNASHIPTAPTTTTAVRYIYSQNKTEKLRLSAAEKNGAGQRQLGLFEAEVRSILAGQRPRLVHVIYFDAAVQKVETYQAGQPISLSPVGGGGTDFRPCFDWLYERGIVPQTLVFLTDLCGSLPNVGPRYPVIWASTEARKAPFGEVVPMEAV